MAKGTKFEDLLDEALKTGKGVLDKDPNVKEYPNPTTAKELGIFNSDKEQGVTVSIPQTNAPINVTVNMDMRTQKTCARTYLERCSGSFRIMIRRKLPSAPGFLRSRGTP